MADEEVIDLVDSDDEVALKEEDRLSLSNFGLPASQQTDPDFEYISARVPVSDADALYAQFLQRKELERAETEEKEERTTNVTSSSFGSSSPYQASFTPELQSALIAEHRSHLNSADPFVQVHSLLVLYSTLLFHNSLAAVSVRWSNRMTLCAGLCRYDVRGGGCEIALSESLLCYRSKQEVIETLLHEMIHAYLFVGDPTQRDHDAHGPNFCSHMRRINDMLGLRISVYHTFHAEVRQFKRHVWQCQGKCQGWKPYFGKVSRAMNRKPGPYDSWWAQHQNNCGGYFIKTQGPTDEELKQERKEKAKKKRLNKKQDREREEKGAERREDERRGLRQTDLKGSMTITKTKRKSGTQTKTETKKKVKGEQQTGEETKEGEGDAKTKDAETDNGEATSKKKKKFPGKGHVLGDGGEVPTRAKRKKKAVPESVVGDDDHPAEIATSSVSTASSTSPVVAPPRKPTTSDDTSAVPSLSLQVIIPTSRASSSISSSPPLTGRATTSSAAAAGSAPATGTRPRTTNIFDLMAARGDRGKVDQLLNKTKQAAEP